MGIVQVEHLEPKEKADPIIAMGQLLGRQFDITITPDQIEDLFSKHWHKLSPLAHAVHEKLQQRKRVNG